MLILLLGIVCSGSGSGEISTLVVCCTEERGIFVQNQFQGMRQLVALKKVPSSCIGRAGDFQIYTKELFGMLY